MLCSCWRLIRRDGVILGFTDHDRDVVFDQTTFSANSALDASVLESEIGLAVTGAEVSGALRSQAIRSDDIAAGDYDGASVEIWRVNWTDPQQRILMDVAVIGEIRRTPNAFSAELRSLAHVLDQQQGRLYQNRCSAELADERCQAILDSAAFRTMAPIIEALGAQRILVELPGFADGWFSGGLMKVLDGDNADRSFQLNTHRQSSEGAVIDLVSAPPSPLLAGLNVELTAGCDKRFETCRNKFSNHLNFRGFPHIPGNDALLAHAGNTKARMDGGSMFR